MRTRVGEVALRVPQTRGYHDADGRPFYPESLERGVRSERAMTLAVAEMFVQEVSTRKVTAVVQQLCGLEVTSTQVSRAAAELDEQLTAWRSRPIGEITYLILDARYEKIRHGGAVVPCAVLPAIGVSPDGKRAVLGCSVEFSEAEYHWRTFLQSLLAHRMRGMKLIVSDDHAGLKAARSATLHGIPWQWCQFHTIRNAMAHVPKASMRADVTQDLKRVFNADDVAEADRRLKEMVTRYQKPAPGLADWRRRCARSAKKRASSARRSAISVWTCRTRRSALRHANNARTRVGHCRNEHGAATLVQRASDRPLNHSPFAPQTPLDGS